MEIHRLGRTGLKISSLCLGTMTFGNQTGEDEAFAIMDRAVEAGVTFFDTADVYPVVPSPATWGRTEAIIGRWLAARGARQRIVLATKGRGRVGTGPNDQGLSRKHLLDAIDASLRRLQTDYVDLYQVHAFDPDTPLDETLRALDTIVRTGRARYVGCSNFAAWQLCKALWISDVQHLARFDSVQPRYNLLDRTIEAELLPLCADQQIGVIPYSPLGGGLLTGKYSRGNPPDPQARYYLFGREAQVTPAVLDAVEGLSALAQAHNLSVAQLSLAWMIANPLITAPIVGATRAAQLDETLAVADKPLAPDLVAEANAIVARAGV